MTFTSENKTNITFDGFYALLKLFWPLSLLYAVKCTLLFLGRNIQFLVLSKISMIVLEKHIV